jgi:Zn-dependent protease
LAGGLAVFTGILIAGFFSSVTMLSYRYHVAMFTEYSIQAIAINAIPLLFAITIHEAAHGYAAKRLGDNTAFVLGRVTLNPLKHIDPIGTILIPALLILSSAPFLVGYAKPVPVRFDRLNNPKMDMVWVALAGPGSNFFQALLWAIFWLVIQSMGIQEPFFLKMAEAGVLWNIGLLVFNLFPLLPLDGGRIVSGLLPYRQALAFSKIEPWGFFIVLGLVFTGFISHWWMNPLNDLFLNVIRLITMPIRLLLGH